MTNVQANTVAPEAAGNQASASQMPENVAAHIRAFAKAKKIGVAAVEAFTMDIINMIPKEESKENTNVQRRVRQATEKNMNFRSAVIAKLDEMKGKQYTFKQIAEMFDMDAPNATNNLFWLKEHGKVTWKEVGKAEKAPGVRGPKAALIEFS